ncbi:hypothetical protein P43SY_000288 [Pythium insidiosum]|uniref:Multidrug/Oligosaccharidyl-lipid/Polysaccharide (MOP) Flippase Superfamily n=1 Tax=Pythium insidiosum TaxID=114742 RepID=A0AAD5Q6L8_PYTIN|nr:hypothetical protein P43SY_000288 [Pythium insidiosum]
MDDELQRAAWPARLALWATRLKAVSLALHTRPLGRDSSVCVTHDALSLRMLPDWPAPDGDDEDEDDELDMLFKDNDSERRGRVIDRWRDVAELLELCALLSTVDRDAWLQFADSIPCAIEDHNSSRLRRDEHKPWRPRCHVRIDARYFYRGKEIGALFRSDCANRSESFPPMRQELLTALNGRLQDTRCASSLVLEVALGSDIARPFNEDVAALVAELRQLWETGSTRIQLEAIELSDVLPDLARSSVRPLLALGVPVVHLGLPNAWPAEHCPSRLEARLGLLRLLPPSELQSIDGDAVLPQTSQRTLCVPQINNAADIEVIFSAVRSCSTTTTLELPDVVGLDPAFWRWFAFSVLERSARHALQSISLALSDMAHDSMAAMGAILSATSPITALGAVPTAGWCAFNDDDERRKRLRLTPEDSNGGTGFLRFARLQPSVEIQLSSPDARHSRHHLEFSCPVYAPVLVDNPNAPHIEVFCSGIGRVLVARTDVSAIVEERDVPEENRVSSASTGVTRLMLYVHNSVERGPETIHAFLRHLAPLRQLRVLSLHTPWTTGLYDATLSLIIELFPRLESLTLRPIALVSFQPLLDAYALRQCSIRSLSLLNLKCSGTLAGLHALFDALKSSSGHLIAETLEELALRPEPHADSALSQSVDDMHDHITSQALAMLRENLRLRELALELRETALWRAHQQAAQEASGEFVAPVSRRCCVALLSAFRSHVVTDSRQLAREIVLEILGFAAQPTRRTVTLVSINPLRDEPQSRPGATVSLQAFRRGVRRTNSASLRPPCAMATNDAANGMQRMQVRTLEEIEHPTKPTVLDLHLSAAELQRPQKLRSTSTDTSASLSPSTSTTTSGESGLTSLPDARAKRPDFWTELLALLGVAWPIILTAALEFLPDVLTMLFVGQIESDENADFVAAAALSVLWVAAVMSPGLGMAVAMETLCAQAHGAGRIEDIAAFVHVGLLLLGVVFFPIAYAVLHTEAAMLALGQPAEVAKLAGGFTRRMLPGIPFWLLHEVLKKVLQAQGHTQIGMFTTLANNLVNAALAGFVVHATTWGFYGVAVARCFANFTSFMLLVLFMRQHAKALQLRWRSWRPKASTTQIEATLALAVPGTGLVLLDLLAFEVTTAFLGHLPNSVIVIGANSVLINVANIASQVFAGVSTAISIGVGNSVGSGLIHQARHTSSVGVAAGLLLASAISIGILASHRSLPHLFISDAASIALAVDALLVVIPFVLTDALNTAFLAVLRGTKQHKVAVIANILGFGAVGLPLGYFLTFNAGQGVAGFWIGVAFGNTASALISLAALSRYDWDTPQQYQSAIVVRECEV